MCKIVDLERKIKDVIDNLKSLCSLNGLSNGAAEEVIITSVFLYKFLNDKFMYNIKRFAEEMEVSYEDVLNNTDSLLDAFRDVNSMEVQFNYEDTIEYLIQHLNDDDFYTNKPDYYLYVKKENKTTIRLREPTTSSLSSEYSSIDFSEEYFEIKYSLFLKLKI